MVGKDDKASLLQFLRLGDRRGGGGKTPKTNSLQETETLGARRGFPAGDGPAVTCITELGRGPRVSWLGKESSIASAGRGPAALQASVDS